MSTLFYLYLCGRIATEWLTYMKKSIFFLSINLFSLILLSCLTIFLKGNRQLNSSDVLSSTNSNINYPINELGETFGGDIKWSTDQSPELILVKNEDGLVGYIKASDMDPNPPTTPAEAASYESNSFFVPMYLQDGYTKIGEFKIGQ